MDNHIDISPVVINPKSNYFNSRNNRRAYMHERDKILETLNKINSFFVKDLFDERRIESYTDIFNYYNCYWLEYASWVKQHSKYKFARVNSFWFNEIYKPTVQWNSKHK